jgi:predicted small lipoprotein YifL
MVALSGCGQKGPLVLPPPVVGPQSKPPAERPAERAPDRAFPDVPATNEPR